MSLRVGIHGATGRMGRRLVELVSEAADLKLAAALEHDDHPSLGQDAAVLAGKPAANVPLSSSLPGAAKLDVMIDFSGPVAALSLLDVCVARKLPIVIGTTGFEPDQRARLDAATAAIPVFLASNFSKAVNLLIALTGLTARALGESADIEIVERHHHFKKDAPSGTALSLAEAAAQAIGKHQFVHGRHGQGGERPSGEIGLHALRCGDNPGEHTVVFGLMGECLELSHRALNRDGFCRGALDAARFLAGKPPGSYRMSDLLADLLPS